MNSKEHTDDIIEFRKKLEAETEASRAENKSKLPIYNAIKKFFILILVATIGCLYNFKYSFYISGNAFKVDLQNLFERFFSPGTSEIISGIVSFIVPIIGIICMIYTLYVVGLFHWLGRGNSSFRTAKYSNIERVKDYRNSMMAAKSPDDALELLIETSGMDALTSGKLQGTNIERTVGYLDGIMGAKNSEDALKIFTGKK